MSLFTRTALAGLWLFLATTSLSAQFTLSLPELSQIQPGSTIQLPVTTENFTAMTSLQFGIAWDSTVLSFDTVYPSTLSALNLSIINNFGLTGTSGGKLRFGWVSGSVQNGTTIPNGTTLFTLVFQVIGAANANTAVQITEFPPVMFFEAVNAQGQVFGPNDVALNQGAVCVDCNVATQDLPEQLDITVFPNPATAGRAQARFTLAEPATVRFSVTDATGRATFEQQLELAAGQQAVDLPIGATPANGLYYLTLRTAKNNVGVRPFLID